MRRLFTIPLLVLSLAILATPAFADGGDDGRVVFGQNVVIKDGEVVHGDLVVFGGNVRVEEGGLITGDAVVIGGQVSIAGRVTGSVVVMGGNVTLKATAVVDRDLVLLGGQLQREPGAVVKGNTMEGFEFWRVPRYGGFTTLLQVTAGRNLVLEIIYAIFRAVVTILALTILGLLVVLFLPRQTELVAETAYTAALPSLGVGLLSLFALALVVPLLVIICIGIPAAILLVIAAGMAALYGWISVGLLVGQRIMEGLGAREVVPLVAVVLGVLLISFLAAVPCLGWLVALFLGCLGLGAVVLSRFGTMPYYAGRGLLPVAVPQPPATTRETGLTPAEPESGED